MELIEKNYDIYQLRRVPIGDQCIKRSSNLKNITLEKLDQTLNRSQSFIANIENGERRLDVVKLVYIVRLLSLDLA